MSIIDASQLFLQVIWMMVGTPIIGLPLALVLSILLAERISIRQRLQAITRR